MVSSVIMFALTVCMFTDNDDRVDLHYLLLYQTFDSMEEPT